MQRFGKASNGKQRFRCTLCKKTFVWKQPHVKKFKEQHWFKLWIMDSYSVRKLVDLSGHSASKLKRIKSDWLTKSPREPEDLSSFKYLVMDATYFHKEGCLITLMNATDQSILSTLYTSKEGNDSTSRWLATLKEHCLDPLVFITDGERFSIRAIKLLWPYAKIQRCLYHIQHEGCRWLRTYPKTTAGKTLRMLLLTLTKIRSIKERNQFIDSYKAWTRSYLSFVLSLPMNVKSNFDLKRTITLINNALPDMFHYLMDPSIHSTTNALEGWHSRIKRAYRQHAGLSHLHKIQFLKWFSFFENQQKFNNL